MSSLILDIGFNRYKATMALPEKALVMLLVCAALPATAAAKLRRQAAAVQGAEGQALYEARHLGHQIGMLRCPCWSPHLTGTQLCMQHGWPLLSVLCRQGYADM